MVLLSRSAAHTNRTNDLSAPLQRNTPGKNHDLAVVGRMDPKELTAAPDPYRPRVRLLLDRTGVSVLGTREINLWEAGEGGPQSIQAPLDPADYDIDPLTHLE